MAQVEGGFAGAFAAAPGFAVAWAAGDASEAGTSFGAAGAFVAGDRMSNRRTPGASAGLPLSGGGVASSVGTSTDGDASSSRRGRGATGVRSAGESSIPASGTKVAVFAPSADIHSASALSRSATFVPTAGVVSAGAGPPVSRNPSSDSRPANSLMPSTVRSTP